MTTTSIFLLPTDLQRQAARDMLVNPAPWHYYGAVVKRPDALTLRALARVETPTSVAAAPAEEKTASGVSGALTTHARMTIQEKRAVVARAIAENAGMSAREIARRTGLSHRFVSLMRRKLATLPGGG